MVFSTLNSADTSCLDIVQGLKSQTNFERDPLEEQ